MGNKKNYRINTPNGIDEKTFVSINGQAQYISIRGKDINNPIILNLHGGPANPDNFIIYEFVKEICSDYTFVSWDQRGCGRTYFKNKHADPLNQTATFEQAIKDVDALVDYLCNRFAKNKIMILGHSYGTLLGINYVHTHPEKVACYIGIGQTVSIMDTQTANYHEIIGQLTQAKQNTDTFTVAYNTFKKEPTLKNLSAFQQLSLRHFTKHLKLQQPNQLKFLFSSPDLSWTDIRWILGMLSLKKHYARNKNLLDYALSSNVYDVGDSFDTPMFFISGEHDKSCNTDLVRTYYEKITAPAKEMIILENCGHSPQIDAPAKLASEIKRLKANFPH